MNNLSFGREKDGELLATRRAWKALEGWELVRTFTATKGNAIHTVMKKDDEYRCTCADYVYRGRLCKHMQEVGAKKVFPPDRRDAATPDLVVDMEHGLEEAMAFMLASKGTLWIPSCWDWLLRDEFPTPCGKGPATDLAQNRAFRHDKRVARARVGDYEVQARLFSGATNYWLEFAVVKGTKVIFEGTADGRKKEVDFDVPDDVRIEVDGVELVAPVKRYSTKNVKRGKK